MTQDEREQLVRFLSLLNGAQAGQKDGEADSLIRDAIARQPDAGYLLVQRVMQLEFALQAAQSEADQLKRDLAQTRTGLPASSFLGSPNEWGRKPNAPAAAAPASQAGFQPAMARAGQPVSQPSAQPAYAAARAPASSWGSGIMGTVAGAAVGVVAGSMLAQGIGSMMGNHNKTAASDKSETPPGGGTDDNTDRYGDGSAQNADSGYVAEDFDTSDSGGGGGGDSGGDIA